MKILNRKLNVGIAGCGAIGTQLAEFIEEQLESYFTLKGLYDIVSDKAFSLAKKLKGKPDILGLNRLISSSDFIIESASVFCARDLIYKACNKGKIVFIISTGVFVKYPAILEKARSFKKVIVPSGAICGIDGISSLSLSKIKSLKLITSKPPSSLKGIKFLEQNNIDVSRIRKEKVIFKGRIKDAIERFPKNINVAATLFLASRFNKIEVIIKVNPHMRKNTHHIELISDKGKLSITLENVPSKINPKTSAITILSAKNTLKRFTDTLLVGG